MSRYGTEFAKDKESGEDRTSCSERPEPTWVINSRQRHLGDPHYSRLSHNGYPDFGPYTQGPLLPDVVVRVPLVNLEDVARIKDVLSVEGVTNVICDIPEQTVVVSSSLPPQVIVSLIRRVFLNAHILNYIDPHRAAVYPAEPPFSLPGHRYAYDDTYSYWGHTNYTPAYENAYRGRAYDNEFRPSRYSPYTYH